MTPSNQSGHAIGSPRQLVMSVNNSLTTSHCLLPHQKRCLRMAHDGVVCGWRTTMLFADGAQQGKIVCGYTQSLPTQQCLRMAHIDIAVVCGWRTTMLFADGAQQRKIVCGYAQSLPTQQCLRMAHIDIAVVCGWRTTFTQSQRCGTARPAKSSLKANGAELHV